MILTFPAFFASAPEDSAEGSRSGPQASARTADEVRAPRDLTDIFFDAIKATVEAFDGR